MLMIIITLLQILYSVDQSKRQHRKESPGYGKGEQSPRGCEAFGGGYRRFAVKASSESEIILRINGCSCGEVQRKARTGESGVGGGAYSRLIHFLKCGAFYDIYNIIQQ